MNEAGLVFQVIPSDAEEIHDATLRPPELTEENGRLKAAAVAIDHPDATVLGADTLVFLEGEPLGKPTDMENAAEMLRRLVGKTHQVCTGVCLCREGGSWTSTFHDITHVTFKPLTDSEIAAYLTKIDPLDKAGSYAAQDHGELIIERIEGSWSNVVGLPMEKLLSALAQLD